MNIQAINRPTAAESALISAYGEQVGILPGDGAVLAARDVLFDDLKRGGLPTRRVEAWHYTDLKNLLRNLPDSDPGTVAKAVAPFVPGACVLALEQGVAATAVLPDGVTATAYRDNLMNGSAAAGLAAFDRDDAIGRINGSFVGDGFAIDIAADTVLEAPLELQIVHGAGQVHGRFPVSFGANCRATVFERHLNTDGAAAFVSSVSDVSIGDGAQVTWIILQTQGLEDSHFGQIKVDLGANVNFRLFVINAGGKLVRQEIHVKTSGEGSDFKLRGINLLGGDSHTDLTMTLGHDVPNTTSTEVIRSVVFDRAHGIFQGQIRVAPDAQKTDARMACNTLLMSDDGEFSVKPELEIFADDVQCAHGATVTDIDHNHLYYLMARGIPEKPARGLLINAFVAEIAEELEEEVLVEALEALIADWLDHHG